MANTPKDKALRDVGLAALCYHITRIRENLGHLAEATADSLEEVDTLLDGKADISEPVELTIPAAGWMTDSAAAGFPMYIDLSVPGLLGTDVVEVNVSPESTAIARAADFTNTESMDGVLRLRAGKVPAAEIKARYRVITAAAQKAAEDQEGGS